MDYLTALENIEDAIWYMSQVIDITDEDCQKVLKGLQQASDTLDDCRDEVCYRCSVDRGVTPEKCDDCRWGE
jgi:TnpA family transposase